MLEFLSISSLFSVSIETVMALRLRDKRYRFIEAEENREPLGADQKVHELRSKVE
jgi:hypothetical protein